MRTTAGWAAPLAQRRPSASKITLASGRAGGDVVPDAVSLRSSREKPRFSRTKKKGSQWLPSGSTFRDLRHHRRRVLDEAKFALASLQPFAGRASALFLFTMLGIIRIERADEF